MLNPPEKALWEAAAFGQGRGLLVILHDLCEKKLVEATGSGDKGYDEEEKREALDEENIQAKPSVDRLRILWQMLLRTTGGPIQRVTNMAEEVCHEVASYVGVESSFVDAFAALLESRCRTRNTIREFNLHIRENSLQAEDLRNLPTGLTSEMELDLLELSNIQERVQDENSAESKVASPERSVERKEFENKLKKTPDLKLCMSPWIFRVLTVVCLQTVSM